MGEFRDLLKQDITIFDDSNVQAMYRTKSCAQRRGKELQWPALALGEAYPVTDDRGRILRYEPLQGAEGLV